MKIWPWSRIAALEQELLVMTRAVSHRDSSIRALMHQNQKLVDQNQNLKLRVHIAENKNLPDFTSINTAP